MNSEYQTPPHPDPHEKRFNSIVDKVKMAMCIKGLLWPFMFPLPIDGL